MYYAAASSDPYGGTVAGDGDNYGEENGLTIGNPVTLPYCVDGGTRCATVSGVVELTWGAPGAPMGGGDSGAPVFSLDSSGRVKPYGEFVAYNSTKNWYLPARTLLAHFGSGSTVVLCTVSC